MAARRSPRLRLIAGAVTAAAAHHSPAPAGPRIVAGCSIVHPEWARLRFVGQHPARRFAGISSAAAIRSTGSSATTSSRGLRAAVAPIVGADASRSSLLTRTARGSATASGAVSRSRRCTLSERSLQLPSQQCRRGLFTSVPRVVRAQVNNQARCLSSAKDSNARPTRRENIYNLPNFLTVTRLLAAPTTAYLLLHDHHTAALALFAYAGVTDLVDGWMARRWKLQTVAGSVIDPMADKALMIILTVTLAVKGAIPAYLATLILGRDASLAIAAIYYRYASLPPPKTMMRYWDFSLPSAEVHPTTVSKYNTFLQLILIGSTLALPVITAGSANAEMLQQSLGVDSAQLNLGLTYLQYLVAATTLWSGLSYAYLKDAVTIMGSNEELKARQGVRGRAIIGVTFGSLVLLAAWFALQRSGPAQGAQPAELDKPDEATKAGDRA